jgi:hypothetical protein
MGSPYNCSVSGPWNAAGTDTWGQGLGVFPNAPGDVWNLGVNKTVTYNVSSAVELGNGTISALSRLLFSRSMSTLLSMGDNTITVTGFNAGLRAFLDMGTIASPIPAAFTAGLLFNTTSDGVKGIFNANSFGDLTFVGHEDYYGADGETVLNADIVATDTTFTIVGNYSAKWQDGQEIYIHKGNAAQGIDDIRLVTLNGAPSNAANSVCTINEAAFSDTYNAGAKVVNASKNVYVGKVGASLVIGSVGYNTNRPKINLVSAIATSFVADNAMFTGMYGLIFPIANQITNCTWRNGKTVVDSARGINLTGNYIVNQAPVLDSLGCVLNGNWIRNGQCVNNGMFHSLEGDFYFNITCSFESQSNFLVGNFFGNSIVINKGSGHIITGRIGYDGNDTLMANGDDFGTYILKAVSRSFKMVTPPVFFQRNFLVTTQHPGNLGLYCENYGEVNGASYAFTLWGDVIKNTVTVRPGGAPDSIEVIPLSRCKELAPIQFLDWTVNAVPAASQNKHLRIRGSGWTGFPTNTKLWFEAEYISNAVTLEKTIVKSTAVLVDNITWETFSIPAFTPAVVGVVRYRGFLAHYEAASKIFVDNALY